MHQLSRLADVTITAEIILLFCIYRCGGASWDEANEPRPSFLTSLSYLQLFCEQCFTNNRRTDDTVQLSHVPWSCN